MVTHFCRYLTNYDKCIMYSACIIFNLLYRVLYFSKFKKIIRISWIDVDIDYRNMNNSPSTIGIIS